MKKSNIIVLAVAAAVSVFLLALWFILGFNHVDSPVDPLVTLVWWIVIVAAVLIINKVESTRRERIRSVYVGEGQLFNSELGLVSAQPGTSLVGNVASIVENLDYGFGKQDFPEEDQFTPRLLVRTTEYKRDYEEEQGQDQQGRSRTRQRVTWKGEVVFPKGAGSREFNSPEELHAILATA